MRAFALGLVLVALPHQTAAQERMPLTFAQRWMLGQQCAKLFELKVTPHGSATAFVSIQAGCESPTYEPIDLHKWGEDIYRAKRAQLDRSCAAAEEIGGLELAMLVAGCRKDQ